jgi:isopentenyldiphosphate isomerase
MVGELWNSIPQFFKIRYIVLYEPPMSGLIIEVNENNKQIGKQPISEFIAAKRIYRCVHLIILSHEGETLVQKRKKDDAFYPSAFGFAVSSPVMDGEKDEACIERAMESTLGIKVHSVEFTSFLTKTEVDGTYNIVYTTYSDGPFRINSNLIESVEWMRLKSLKEELGRRPDKFLPSYLQAMNAYYEQFGSEGESLNSLDW